jgi:hypothetical protein
MPGASCWPSSWPSCCAALRGRQRVDELLPVRWPRPSCCAALRGRHGPGARPELAKLLPAARPPAVELAELLPAAGRRAAAGRPAPGRRPELAADGARPPAARPRVTRGPPRMDSCRQTLPFLAGRRSRFFNSCRATLPFFAGKRSRSNLLYKCHARRHALFDKAAHLRLGYLPDHIWRTEDVLFGR